MMYGVFFRVNNKMLVNDPEIVQSIVKSQIRSCKKQELKKSKYLIFRRVLISDQNNDEFISNLSTVRIDFTSYKVNRIIKNLKTKK